MYTAKAHCPCCEKEFTGTGSTQEEADEMANERLQDHLDSEEC